MSLSNQQYHFFTELNQCVKDEAQSEKFDDRTAKAYRVSRVLGRSVF